jgi:hypothetical protein
VDEQQDFRGEALGQEQRVGIAGYEHELVEEQADRPDIIAAAVMRQHRLPGDKFKLEEEEGAEESREAEENSRQG